MQQTGVYPFCARDAACVEVGGVVWSACQHVADNAPTSLSLAHRCVSRRARTARQSLDCLRVRSLSDPRLCVKVALLRARYPPPLARARLRCGAASRSATAQPPLVPRAASIRECGLHGLVGIPPCALQRRLAASAVRGRRIALWPRSPAPLHLRAVGTCHFSRGASVAACTA